MAGVLALLLLVLLAGSPTVARAAFPGKNGQLVFSTGPTPDLFAIDFDGRNARGLIIRPGRDNRPAWSPDGRQVAWVNNASGKDQIYIADADGRNVRRFAQSTAFDSGPAWSPDGRKMLFTSGRDNTGTTELYVADTPNGTNVRRLTFRPLEDGIPNWSPDGTKIVWHSRETNTDKFHIYVMNADGSNQRRLFPNRSAPDTAPIFSPDGRRLLWTSYSDRYEIWVGNADGTGAQRIVENKMGTYSPVWSPDGKLIAYSQQRGQGQNFEVWVARADGSGSSVVIGIDKNPFGVGIDWQPVAERGAQPVSLLRDGGTEDGFGGYFSQVDYPVPGWASNGGLSALRYGLPGFPAAASLPPVKAAARKAQKPVEGLRISGGKRFFFGGNAPVSTAVQDVDLSAKATEIDTGSASVTLSGLVGGKAGETDEGTVVATFLNAQGMPIGLVQLNPVSPADRGNATTFVSRLQTAKLPAGTRKIRVTLTAIRRIGSTNDVYFDNLALVYAKPEAIPPATPPAPVQPPPVTPPGTGVAGVAGDAGAGRISNLKISPTPFASAKDNTATIAQKRRRPPRGAKISYALDRAGLVTMKVNRQSPGRRSTSGECVKPTKANRKRKRCTRLTTVATILRLGRAGGNTVAFTGRVNGKALKAGSYRLTASTANSVSVKFKVVKR